jgi:hypothetical protein
MSEIYIQFKNGNFDGFHHLLPDEILPDNGVIITSQAREEYILARDMQLKNVILINGEIQIVDKYTPAELAAEANQQQLNHANALLNQSIKLDSGVYQRRMSTDEKSEFEAWQDDLLAFIDGDSETLPMTPEFIQALL